MSFSVIIPSRNAANLVPCIRAIREAGETCRIIVVDDFPYPMPVQISWWKVEGLDLRRDLVVTGADPFVFARNINIGIRAAGTDDVILLNDDALLKTPMGFTFMSAAAREYKDVGIIAAACDTVGNQNQFRRAGALLRPEPRMLCFVCVYIPRSAIDTVGLLDERFIDYGLDDDDFSFRVRAAGLKLGVFDGCYVDHASLTSSFRGPAGAGGDCTANMRRFIEKWKTDNWGQKRESSRFGNLFPKETECP